VPLTESLEFSASISGKLTKVTEENKITPDLKEGLNTNEYRYRYKHSVLYIKPTWSSMQNVDVEKVLASSQTQVALNLW
jgi:hypothetical protein